jgi:hypothetical protein
MNRIDLIIQLNNAVHLVATRLQHGKTCCMCLQCHDKDVDQGIFHPLHEEMVEGKTTVQYQLLAKKSNLHITLTPQ